MIDREVVAIARTGAERSDAENVGNELILVAVPGEDHGAGAGEALRFRNGERFQFLMRLILNEAVGPGDADGIGIGMAVDREGERDAEVNLLFVIGAGFHFDGCAGGRFEIFDALQADGQPALGGRSVESQNDIAIGREAGDIFALIAIEIGARAKARRLGFFVANKFAVGVAQRDEFRLIADDIEQAIVIEVFGDKVGCAGGEQRKISGFENAVEFIAIENGGAVL